MPERWQELQELFGQALEIPPADRAAFIDRSCGEDAWLRRELTSLLDADAKAAGFISSPAPELGSGSRGRQGPRPSAVWGVLEQLVPEFPNGHDETRALGNLGWRGLDAGTLVGSRYRIRGQRGRGGMGEVYQAEDVKLGQDVALKLLPWRFDPGTDALARELLDRLINEVKIAREVAHPNVCRMFDIGEVDGLHYLSMEYIEGPDLAAWLGENGSPPLQTALALALELCAGLDAVHRCGILHRDLKPANLMVESTVDGPRIRLTDFGLASLDLRLTGSEARHGTPAYMAPEQHQGLEATVRSDIYSLGLVLYELFTGRRASLGEDAAELAHWHCEEEPVPPSRFGLQLPEGVEDVVLACLAKDPRERPASVPEVSRVLRGEATSSFQVLAVLRTGDGTNPSGDAAARLSARALQAAGRSLDTACTRWLFDRPIAAVRFALEAQKEAEDPLRIALHFTEIDHDPDPDSPPASPDPGDLSAVTQLAELAEGGQVLLTRGVFDLARQQRLGVPGEVRWLAHGAYEVESFAQPVDLCEVGRPGYSPLRAPRESKSVRRCLVQETVSGWRPSPGLDLPPRPEFRLDRKLSEGGFGEVWLAVHRTSGERRTFKFCFDAARLRSLQREATLFRLMKEALGDRPDVTRILDWNFDEAPYFIESEYSEGGSFAEWAEQQGGIDRIPLELRLELVAQVASALAAAHSVGVLHKDVKPGNVLILPRDGDRPTQARLNDFGLGLITEKDRLSDIGITALGFTELMPSLSGSDSYGGTRLYMAPELLEGKPPTVQADIYALGVLLYQAVVGDFSRALAVGWEREIDDELLVEDIAAATDGLPSRRLRDAERLAERLRTLEERRAVRRREDHDRQEAASAKEALVRSRQRRNLFAVAAAFLLIFALAMVVQSRRVAKQAELAERTLLSMEQLFEAFDPKSGLAKELSTELGRILKFNLLQVRQEHSDEPALVASHANSVGKIYVSLGLFSEAEALYQDVLAVRREVHGGKSKEVAATLNAIAEARIGKGKYLEAEDFAREALMVRESVFGRDHPALAESLVTLGKVLQYRAEVGEASEFLEQALEIQREHFGADSLQVARLQVEIANLWSATGKFDSAREFLEQARSIQQRELGADHILMAATLASLANVILFQDNYVQPAELMRKALEIRRGWLGDDHPDVAMDLRNLGNILVDQGHYEEAEEKLLDALRVFIASLGTSHHYVAMVYSDLAVLRREQGRPEETPEYFARSVEIYQDAYGETDPLTVRSQGYLAKARARIGDVAQARADLIPVLDAYEALGKEKTDLFIMADLHRMTGEVLTMDRDYERAELYLRLSLEETQELIRRDPVMTEFALIRKLMALAELYREQKHYDRAEGLLNRVLQIREELFGPLHPNRIEPLQELFKIAILREDATTAESLMDEISEIQKRTLPADSEKGFEAVRLMKTKLARLQPDILPAG